MHFARTRDRSFDGGRLGNVGARDGERLDQYLTGVRDLEQRLAKAREWEDVPKPAPRGKSPEDPATPREYFKKVGLLYDMARLAFETDSTRLVTIMLAGSTNAPPIAGVSLGHHDLSHHGKDPGKLAQLSLEIVERWTFEFRGTNLLAWEHWLLDLNPSASTLPLGYDGLLAWEAWLEANHPDDAARYLNPREEPVPPQPPLRSGAAGKLLPGAERDWVINGYRFAPNALIPYDPAFADQIEASIREYLDSR